MSEQDRMLGQIEGKLDSLMSKVDEGFLRTNGRLNDHAKRLGILEKAVVFVAGSWAVIKFLWERK